MPIRSLVYSRLATLLLPLSIAACRADEHKEPSAPEQAPPTVTTGHAQADLAVRAKLAPTLGGSVFLVGDYQAELAVHEDGVVDGLVFEADTKALPHERVSGYDAVLALEGGATLPLTLSWDASAQRFRGRAALTAELVARPIDVTLEIDGKGHSSVLEDYTLLPALPASEAKAPADLTAEAKALGDARVRSAPAGAKAAQKSVATANAKLGVKAQLDVPKPKVAASAKTSAKTQPNKSGASATVKAKASFGLGQ